MTTYLVEYTEAIRYRVEIEADDEDGAREAFWADDDDVRSYSVFVFRHRGRAERREWIAYWWSSQGAWRRHLRKTNRPPVPPRRRRRL